MSYVKATEVVTPKARLFHVEVLGTRRESTSRRLRHTSLEMEEENFNQETFRLLSLPCQIAHVGVLLLDRVISLTLGSHKASMLAQNLP
jgi:hypothetical protein